VCGVRVCLTGYCLSRLACVSACGVRVGRVAEAEWAAGVGELPSGPLCPAPGPFCGWLAWLASQLASWLELARFNTELQCWLSSLQNKNESSRVESLPSRVERVIEPRVFCPALLKTVQHAHAYLTRGDHYTLITVQSA
jgi:hypothetical protein